jgi:7-keto-8-aminopelargonate synthetase-like enzyme
MIIWASPLEPILREAAKAAIDEYGVGSGASRLVCGTLKPHVRLEEEARGIQAHRGGLSFSSGYAAALGALGALCGRDDVVILDKLCHASLIDGAKLCGAAVRVFPHNHLGKLESHLAMGAGKSSRRARGRRYESVFSMDGDWALLPEIIEIKDRYGALLLLDEAHAVGVIGQHGRGLADQLGLVGRVDIQMGTLSKALGVSGGYICGGRRLIELLINRARSFVYSTAPPPASAAAALAAIEFMLAPIGEQRRQTLRENLARFADEMPHLFKSGRKIMSAIIPDRARPRGSRRRSLATARGERLLRALRSVIPPVARDAARLRVTISAKHSTKQIRGVCELLRNISA